MACRRFSVIFLFAALIWPSLQSSAPDPGPTATNCSLRYFLSVGDPSSRSCRQGSCLLSEASLVESCTSLWSILQHGGNISAGDCMELVFATGHYWLPDLAQIRVHFSLVMTASESGVTFACGGSECGEEEGDGDADPLSAGGAGPAEGVTIAMMAFEAAELGNNTMFVKISGIDFINCSRQLEFDKVNLVSISNCTFVGFTSSALDFFNVQVIEIRDSSFRDCTSNNGSRVYRANSGAVSIAYYREAGASTQTLYPEMWIDGCSFVNNRAFLPDINDTDEINQAVNQNFYFGRGGGLSIIVQGYASNLLASISNTTFQQNWAETFGGAVFLLITGSDTSHNVAFENCTFLRNFVRTSFGGGIQVSFLLRNLPDDPSTVIFRNSRFEENSAIFGGGISAVQVYSQGRGNRVVIEGTEFTGNRARSVGAAVMFQTFQYVQSRAVPHLYSVSDCTFSNNVAPGGIFGAGFVSMNFSGDIQFLNNTGPALRLVGGLVVSNGNLSFVGNEVDSNEGGALYIQEFGQVKLVPGTRLQFINNTGRIGSAIVVDVQTSSLVFSELVHNPQCFLIHEEITREPHEWTDVFLKFSGNRASIGPVVFISHLLHCSWYSAKISNETNEIVIIFNNQSFANWTAFDYDNTNMGVSHSDEDPYDPKFYFQTQPINITSNYIMQEIPPGETISLSLNGIDQFHNPTYIIARISDVHSNVNSGAFSQALDDSGQSEAMNVSQDNVTDRETFRFEPALLPVQPDIGRADIRYGFINDVNLSSRANKSVIIDTPFNVIGSNPLFIEFAVSNCRPGYVLRRTNGLYTCQCIDTDFYVLNCEEEVIVLRDGLWAGLELGLHPHLDLTVCPTPYCSCHTRSNEELCESLYFQNSTESRQQCHPSRNGTLCGHCVNGTAVGVLRSNCRHCEVDTYYAIGFLVVGDILIVSFIMFAVIKLNMHFPHSMKGLLFYIQTAYYTTEHFPIAFWDVRQYMLYASSVLGMYFPFDFCLYPGMPSLVAFGLKFIPAILAAIVAVIVMVGSYIVRARSGRKRVWKALWFLVLLLYIPLLHNCVALLKCPLVPNAEGGDEKRHWYFDGEVVCFEDPGHIFLSIVAIIVLAVLVFFIPTLLIFTLIARSRKMKKKDYLTVERMLSALTEGYRDSPEAFWWTSWELLRRLMLVSIVVALPGRSVASAFVVLGAFAMHVFFKPYRKISQNIIEALVLLNYSILILLRSTQTFLDNASTSGYTGTAVPYSSGINLPGYDSIIWLFLPLFYGPLIFTVLYSLGALVYRVIKSLLSRSKTKTAELKTAELDILETYTADYVRGPVTMTEIDGPSL